MREIKFRAWLNNYPNREEFNNKMYPVTYIDFINQLFGINDIHTPIDKQIIENENFDIEGSPFSMHFSEGVLMQYTGLKDKNGKEIYEGDIIKMTEGLNVNDWPTEGEIVYNVSSFVMRTFLKEDMILHLSLNLHDGTKFEIIGNVFENPELLKQ